MADVTPPNDGLDQAITVALDAWNVIVAGRQSLQPEIQAIFRAIGELEAESVATCDRIEAWVSAAADDLATAAEALNATTDAIHEGVDGSLARIDEVTDELTASVATTLDEVTATIDESVVTALDDLGDGVQDAIGKQVDEEIGSERLPELVKRFAGEEVEQLQDLIAEALRQLDVMLQSFTADITGGKTDAERGRSSGDADGRELEALTQPVTDALDRVRGLASSVGIHL